MLSPLNQPQIVDCSPQCLYALRIRNLTARHKARISGNYNELVKVMRDVDIEPIRPEKIRSKNKIKRQADYYVRGTPIFELDGKNYDVDIIAEVNKNGNVVDYD